MKQTSSLCATAPRPLTSRRSSRTGPSLRTALCACRSEGQCVRPGRPWGARRFARRCSSPATPTFQCRCSSSCARSKLAKSRTCASSSLPTRASAGRAACAWTGGAHTFAVSCFIFPFTHVSVHIARLNSKPPSYSNAVSQLHGV